LKRRDDHKLYARGERTRAGKDLSVDEAATVRSSSLPSEVVLDRSRSVLLDRLEKWIGRKAYGSDKNRVLRLRRMLNENSGMCRTV